MRATGAAGVYVRSLQGRSAAAYTAYSLARLAASPAWVAWRYPLELYALALRMEWIFRMVAGAGVWQDVKGQAVFGREAE